MRHLITAFALLAVAVPAYPQGQFDNEPLPAFPYENLIGEIINFETPLIQPILVTADNEYVVAANEPDHRLAIYRTADFATGLAPFREVVVGQGITALSERPASGEIWVSCMFQSSVVVIDPARNWQVTHVLRPDIDTAVGLREAAEPGGIAFNADGSKAFVAASVTDQLLVWDAQLKTHIDTVDLDVTWHLGSIAKSPEPRSVVATDVGIAAVSFKSGNNSYTVPHSAPDPATGTEYGFRGEVIDLNPTYPSPSLPDIDLFQVAPSNHLITSRVRQVGTLNLGLAYDAVHDLLVVSNMDAKNAVFQGEAAFPDGGVVENRLTYVDADTGAIDHIVVLENLGTASDIDLAFPTAVTVDSGGRVFVAAFASARVGVLLPTGGASQFWGAIPTDPGPRGLAIAELVGGPVLYVLNRIAGTIQAFDISSIAQGSVPATADATVTLPNRNAEFDRVREGRALYNDASHSGGDATGCFSCHADLRKDGLGWDLSKFNDDPNAGPYTFATPPNFWLDRKKGMVTQDLRSLEGIPPYHWRGEQRDIDDFNGAFVGLLKGQELSTADFAKLKEYIFSGQYPPNPMEKANRGFTPSADAGRLDFTQPLSCVKCHSLPNGTDGRVTEGFFEGVFSQAQDEINLFAMKTAQLQGSWDKETDLVHYQDTDPLVPRVSMTGFGFNHQGNVNSANEFVDRFFHQRPDTEVAQLTAFLNEFDSGLSPAVTYSYLLDVTTWAGADAKVDNYLLAQARIDFCDVVAHGRLRADAVSPWTDVALLYDAAAPLGSRFLAATTGVGPFGWVELRDKAQLGDAELLFFGVPLSSGQRAGIDRDRDGLLDGDEALSPDSDPVDPDSDDDGRWDGEDFAPNDPAIQDDPASPLPPPALVGTPTTAYVTAHAITINYETTRPSPTRVRYWPAGFTQFADEVGDPWPPFDGMTGLPLNNHWKTHHTAVLRRLHTGINYEFHVDLMGQDAQQVSAGPFFDFTINTPPSRFSLAKIKVTKAMSNPPSIHQTVIPSKFKIRLDLVDHFELPLPPSLPGTGGGPSPGPYVRVNFIATHFNSNGVAVAQVEVRSEDLLIDQQGRVSFNWPHPFQLSLGDQVRIAIPMALPPSPPDDWSAGVQFDAGTSNKPHLLFDWPDRMEFVGSIDIDP